MRILNTPVDAVDMAGALTFIADAVKERNSAGAILAVNPEKVFVIREDAFLRDFFENATLLIPDGIGIVRAMRILYGKRIARCPGADLMQNICREAPERGYRLFLFGSSEEVNAKACEILRERYPGIRIVGRSNGFVKSEEMDGLVRQINESGAEILFVGMGSPRQEKWMSEYASKLTTVKLCQGIGGTLDTIVGTIRRAPRFLQEAGMEWFYRLLCQPSRFRRQLRCFKFAFEVYREKFRGNKG